MGLYVEEILTLKSNYTQVPHENSFVGESHMPKCVRVIQIQTCGRNHFINLERQNPIIIHRSAYPLLFYQVLYSVSANKERVQIYFGRVYTWYYSHGAMETGWSEMTLQVLRKCHYMEFATDVNLLFGSIFIVHTEYFKEELPNFDNRDSTFQFL